MTNEIDIWQKLFNEWDLDTWANILEIVGFVFSVFVFIIGLIIKSELEKIKSNYVFDKRINQHISNLQNSATHINDYLNNYNLNRNPIQSEFVICISELDDLILKLDSDQSKRPKELRKFLNSKKSKTFEEHSQVVSNAKQNFLTFIMPYIKGKTTYNDVWKAYADLQGVIRQMENIKLNKNKSL